MGNPTEIAHGNVQISAVYQGNQFVWMKNPGRFTVDYPGLYVIDTLGRLYTKEDWIWWEQYNGNAESNAMAVGIAVIYSENFMFGISKFDLCDDVNADDGNQPKMFSDPVKTGFRGYYRQTDSDESADRYFNFGNDPSTVTNLGYLPSKEQLDFIRLTPRHFNNWEVIQSEKIVEIVGSENELYAYPNGERVYKDDGTSYLKWSSGRPPYKWPYDFSDYEEMLTLIGGEQLSNGYCKWIADSDRNIDASSLVGRDVPIGVGVYAGSKGSVLLEENPYNSEVQWTYDLSARATADRYGVILSYTEDTSVEFNHFEDLLRSETLPLTVVFNPSTVEAATGEFSATTGIYNNGGYYRYIFNPDSVPYESVMESVQVKHIMADYTQSNGTLTYSGVPDSLRNSAYASTVKDYMLTIDYTSNSMTGSETGTVYVKNMPNGGDFSYLNTAVGILKKFELEYKIVNNTIVPISYRYHKNGWSSWTEGTDMNVFYDAFHEATGQYFSMEDAVPFSVITDLRTRESDMTISNGQTYRYPTIHSLFPSSQKYQHIRPFFNLPAGCYTPANEFERVWMYSLPSCYLFKFVDDTPEIVSMAGTTFDYTDNVTPEQAAQNEYALVWVWGREYLYSEHHSKYYAEVLAWGGRNDFSVNPNTGLYEMRMTGFSEDLNEFEFYRGGVKEKGVIQTVNTIYPGGEFPVEKYQNLADIVLRNSGNLG